MLEDALTIAAEFVGEKNGISSRAQVRAGVGTPPENLGDVEGGPHGTMVRPPPNRSFQGLGLVAVLRGCVRGRSIRGGGG